MTAKNNHQAEIKMALELHRSGAVKEAAAIYQTLLKKNPQNFDLNHYLGMTLIQMGKPDEALPRLRTAVRLNPASVAALSNLAVAHQMAGHAVDALAVFDQIIALRPELPDPYARKAAVLFSVGRFDEAAQAFHTVLTIKPTAVMYNDYGVTLRELGRLDEALQAIEQSIALQADNVPALVNRGNILRDLGQMDAAVDAYNAALLIKPDHPEALENKARAVESALGAAGAAHVAELRAAAHDASARAQAKKTINIDNALLKYTQAFVDAGGAKVMQDARIHVLMQMSDWSEYDSVGSFLDEVRSQKTLISPFALVGLPATAHDQLICAQHYAKAMYPERGAVWRGERYTHDKIRVAYLSSDFHNHATAHLMIGMFERHDRSTFHLTALSAGPDDESEMRHRLEKTFDEFIDIREMSDEAVSQLVHAREIDILVDLKGFTKDSRFGVLSRRCAPVQITYLGYPGTTGSPVVDYAIVDHYVVPDSMLPYFSEKLIFMPHTYQATDAQRHITSPAPTRAALGLPEDKFVFCSFNQTYKITPDMFDVWMRILQRVPDSVFWIYSSKPAATKNLQAEAAKRGIDQSRLIFADFVKSQSDHLARMSRADLCLDNLPCNGHTTTSDALWAGLPVLTCAGETFAGRVAGSLLRAMNMPELICENLADYEEQAVRLATDSQALQVVRQSLTRNKATAPLFDTALFTQHIEQAYKIVYERQRAGEKPEHVDVPLQV